MDSSIASLMSNPEKGDASAADALFTLLCAEPHRLAKAQLARRGAGMPLGTTTLLHGACLDMAGREQASFPDAARFMAYAARATRGLILNHGRGRRTPERRSR